MLGQVSQNRNKQRTQINVFFLTAVMETCTVADHNNNSPTHSLFLSCMKTSSVPPSFKLFLLTVQIRLQPVLAAFLFVYVLISLSAVIFSFFRFGSLVSCLCCSCCPHCYNGYIRIRCRYWNANYSNV